jgi:ubiquitin carboxyl-terminal hydrolase 48
MIGREGMGCRLVECFFLRDLSSQGGILPQTMNIVLNRFQYDYNTQTKKKLKTQVDFPLVLDMAPFLNGRKEIRYHLKAVLMHSGVSANSGHYVSRVWDHSTNSWYNCDDETVERMEILHFEFLEEEVKEAKPKNNRFTSSSAYLLVYERLSPHSFTRVYPKTKRRV